ncbi:MULTISPECIES: acyl carrier protein [Cytobacillus]|uniref:Carrier domain-containing protein n=1 Tax=Cytobacillus oceanisediminis TaxID=665099 RepID=A0ABX3CK33_9BACI|nr:MULTISPECIES: acyl carrier protein [Cytobacillus]OHX39629.1 hypothetical protein BBV17_29490 [Cytobacillus oceanisediminis]
MDNLELKKLILEKVSNSLGREVKLKYDTNLLNEGINSLLLIEIIVELEEVFSIEILDDDLTTDNFNSIDSISNLLLNKYKVVY